MNELEQFQAADRLPPANIESAASRRFNEEAMREMGPIRPAERACVIDSEGFLMCEPLVGFESSSVSPRDDGFELAQ
jgi:hypothetical protein